MTLRSYAKKKGGIKMICMGKRLSIFLSCVVGTSVTIAANASADDDIEIGCGVVNILDEAMIQFSGATHHPGVEQVIDSQEKQSSNQELIAKTLGFDGILSVDVEISGNGNEYTTNAPMRYVVKGNRIEAISGQNLQKLSTWDEFTDTFGAFPQVSCNAAN